MSLAAFPSTREEEELCSYILSPSTLTTGRGRSEEGGSVEGGGVEGGGRRDKSGVGEMEGRG